jgi:RNA polymerase sigma-70 factor (ECF subfamily)
MNGVCDVFAGGGAHRALADAVPGDATVVRSILAGDESAFAELVDQLGPSMIRTAMLTVSSRAVAEEVVQETWISVLRALDRFEGRSSLRTWIFAILGNCARRRADRERRSIPFAAVGDEQPAELDRFFSSDHGRWPQCWTTLVEDLGSVPEDALLADEALATVRAAIDALPEAQRLVITLRDAEGWSSEEVCAHLSITENTQRVLLHRARTRVRGAVERYFGDA